jgi:hypothetical protein
MRSMASRINVSNDIARISDRVMLCQPTVPREHVEALVKLVLECATEAVPREIPEIRRFTCHLDHVADGSTRNHASFSMEMAHPRDSESMSASTPLLTSQEGREIDARLRGLVGQRVVVGFVYDSNVKIRVITDIEPAPAVVRR